MKAFFFIGKNHRAPWLFRILCLLTINCNCLAYHIEGQIKGYSPKWSNRIYLAAINTLNDFHSTSMGMIINRSTLSSDGKFVFEGNNLPSENLFYRIYLTQPSQESQYILGKDQNFIHLLLNNNSRIEIQSDLAKSPFYYAQISGSSYSDYFRNFYVDIFHLTDQNFSNPYSSTNKTQQKFDELVKASLKKYNNEYYTVFILGHLDLNKWFKSDRAYMKDVIDNLKGKLSDQNIYLVELRNRYQVSEFESSLYKDYLTGQYLLALMLLSMFLIVAVVYLSARLHTLSKSKKLIIKDSTNLSLTQKELEIAKLIIEGKTNKEISNLLFIEISTVKSHVGNIFQKLNISSRRELIDIGSPLNQ